MNPNIQAQCRWRLAICLILSLLALSSGPASGDKQTLVEQLEFEAPEVLLYANKITGSKKRMVTEDGPIKYLTEVVSRLEKTGKKVSFSLTLENKEADGNHYQWIDVTKETIHVEIPMRDDLAGSERANQIWSKLVFELAMLESEVSLGQLVGDLEAERTGKEKFVMDVSRVYYEAASESNSFFKRVWKPWSGKRGAVPLIPGEWFANWKLDSFDEWHAQQKKSGGVERWDRWADKLLKKKAG